MNRISFQWRITLMTAVLIAGACICLNLLLYRSGATGMDNLNGYVLQYQQNDDENLMIEIPDDQMSDFLIQFSQEVYDAKAVFGRKGWCITAAVTLLSAAIAYFVSGKALAWGGRYGVGKGYPVVYGVCWHWIRKTVLFWPVSGAGFKQVQRC